MTQELIVIESEFMPALSVPQAASRFWIKVDRSGGPDTCWIWTGAQRQAFGYGMFSIGRKSISTHRYSWLLHNGAIPDGLQVLHHCDNPRCVNPAHLFLGTQKDNVRDARDKGRLGQQVNPMCMARRGEINGKSKLNDSAVRLIRRMRQDGYKLREIADTIGISVPVVSAVATGRTWKHVK